MTRLTEEHGRGSSPGTRGPAETGCRLHVVLVEPEIPQNTGNVARTCAAVGAALHLVHPLGFDISNAAVKRAGLDYWHLLDLHEHRSLSEFLAVVGESPVYFFSTRGGRTHTDVIYEPGAFLVFGRETQGLPRDLLARQEATRPGHVVRIPIRSEARSLNLSNAVAIGVYEALRQQGYEGLAAGAAPMAGPADGRTTAGG